MTHTPPSRLARLATQPLISIAILWLAGLLVFWPALSGTWLLDDVKLLDNIAALHAGGLDTLFSADWTRYLFLDPVGVGRPLSMATLAANALLSDQPAAFKAVNLLLHLATGTLILLLVRTLAGQYMAAHAAALLALAVALAWTLHPLQVSTVAYVVQRMTILPALFSVLALWLYARLRLRELATGTPAPAHAWLVPLVLLPGLAVLAKENGALLVVLLVLLELVLLRLRGPRATRHWLVIWCAAILLGGVAVGLWLLLDPAATDYSGRAFTMAERLLTQARVVSLYVGQILLPRPGAMPFFYDALPHSTGWLAPPTTLAGALFLAALLGLGLALLNRRPLAAFGILFFFAGHLMESTLLPLELAFEHRNYLPSLGLLLAAADLLAAGGGALARVRPAVAGLAIALLAGLTLLRAMTWADPVALYVNALASPWPSQRARAELAQALTDRGQIAAARQLLAQVQGLGPRLHEGWLDCGEQGSLSADRLAAAQAQMGDYPDDYDLSALLRVVNLALDRACTMPLPALLALVTEATSRAALQPTQRATLWLYVGHLRHLQQDLPGALAALEAAFATAPRNPLPLLLGAEWLLDVGDETAARGLYGRARAVKLAWRLNLEPFFREIETRLAAPSP